MKLRLDGILGLKAFEPVSNKLKKDDAKLWKDIEDTLHTAVQDSHEKIRKSGNDKKSLSIALFYELRAIDNVMSSLTRINDQILVREGKLWQHAIVATESFFDSIEHGIDDFLTPIERRMLDELKKKHEWYEGITDGVNSAWQSISGSKEEQEKATLVGELVSKHLAPNIIKKNLEAVFDEANKVYQLKWEEAVKKQSSALLISNKSYSELDVLGAPQAYNPSSAEVAGLVGVSAAVIGTAGLAAGWHTLSYAMLNVFPPIAVFTVIAAAGLAMWNKGKALKEREAQIKEAVRGIHRQLLLQVDFTPIKVLGNKSIRKAMRENSEKILRDISQKWRKALLSGLDILSLEALSSAAKEHSNLILACLSELDEKVPDDHIFFRKEKFKISCSTGIFSVDEREFLMNYGSWLKALADGKIQPYTLAQEHFLQVVKGSEEPNTEHEKIWWRYIKRCELEDKGEY